MITLCGSWRRILAIGTILALTASACAQQGPSAASPTAAPTATAAPAATRGQGGDLKILYWQAPTILNRHLATGTKDVDAARLVNEPLASWGPDGKPLANGLAAEIPTLANGGVSSDLTAVTWKLRQAVKWSDGTPFTADDVIFTYEYTKDPKTGATSASFNSGVKSVVAKDPTTVVVTYDRSNPFYYQWGVGRGSAILQKAQFKDFVGEKAKDAPGNLKPIGTGPYKVKEFKPGDTVTYEMNENYRDPAKPFFKTVTWKGGGDAASAARAVFQVGEADYGWNLQVEANLLGPMVRSSTLGDFVSVTSAVVERLDLNFANPDPALGDRRSEPGTTHPFLGDIAVRRALAMAADRASIAKELYGDGLTGSASCNILTSPPQVISKNTAALDVCRFDLKAAAAELEKAGWVKGPDGVRAKNGVKLAILFQTSVNSVRQKTQDILKKDWESIGFKVELKAVPAGVFFTNTAPDGANKFYADVEMYAGASDLDLTNFLRYYWGTASIASKANDWNGTNYSRYSDPEFEKILSDLKSETNDDKRTLLLIAANDLLVKNVVTVPLVAKGAPGSGKSKALKGVVADPWDSEFYNVADWTK